MSTLERPDLRPRVMLVEGSDVDRPNLTEELRESGLNVGLIAISIAHVAQQIEAGFVTEFDPDVVVVGEAFVDGRGNNVAPLFRRNGLLTPLIAYTHRPVHWPGFQAFALVGNRELLVTKVRGVQRPAAQRR